VDIEEWMRDVGGSMRLDNIDWPAAASALPKGMPGFVPVLDGTIGELGDDLDWPAYGISFKRVFSETTGHIVGSFLEAKAHGALGIQGRLAVCVGWGKDPLIERFWTNRREAIPELASLDFDLVVAPNYSCYGNQPRTEHLLNFRRSLLIVQEMADAGIRSVPNLYWFRLEDIDRQIEAVRKLNLPSVAVNLQTFRTEEDWWGMGIPGMVLLAQALPETTKLVVPFPSTYERTLHLIGLFGPERLVMLSSRSLMAARHGVAFDGEQKERSVKARPRELFTRNVQTLSAIPHRVFGEGRAPSFEEILESADSYVGGLGVAVDAPLPDAPEEWDAGATGGDDSGALPAPHLDGVTPESAHGDSGPSPDWEG
jgi:hypothetical protein